MPAGFLGALLVLPVSVTSVGSCLAREQASQILETQLAANPHHGGGASLWPTRGETEIAPDNT